jgi:hypothetical protein
MFSIYDGRDRFYQWDIDRKLIVDDKTITQVHFANCLCPEAQVCQVYSLEGSWVVDVPNELLTQYMDIRVWGFDGEMTRYEQVIEVEKRTKPADYIYTPEELKKWEDLEKQIEKLKKDVMDCQSLYNLVAELDSLYGEHNERIISLEERVAALENGGGSNSNVLYINGVEYQIETLGATWEDSNVYTSCDAMCGNTLNVWSYDGCAAAYAGSSCMYDNGNEIDYGYLLDENYSYISYNSDAPIPGYHYGWEYIGTEGEYDNVEDTYVSFTINDYEQSACSDYNWEANYSTMCPCPCGEEDLSLSVDSDSEEMRGECNQTGQKYRLVYMDGETPVSIYDYPSDGEVYYTQEV